MTREEMAKRTPKLTAFRNCFEASMDFETALGCAGLADKSEDVIEVLRAQWNRWETVFNS